MEFIAGLLIGALCVYLIKDKPIRFEIKHIQKIEVDKVEGKLPNMTEVMKEKPSADDETYDKMGNLLVDLDNIMKGGGF